MSFVDTIPSLPEDLPCFIIRKPNINAPSGYMDFKIKRDNILAWLLFLKTHNRFYEDLNLEVAQTRLRTIPEDGSIVTRLRNMHEGKCDNSKVMYLS